MNKQRSIDTPMIDSEEIELLNNLSDKLKEVIDKGIMDSNVRLYFDLNDQFTKVVNQRHSRDIQLMEEEYSKKNGMISIKLSDIQPDLECNSAIDRAWKTITDYERHLKTTT